MTHPLDTGPDDLLQPPDNWSVEAWRYIAEVKAYPVTCKRTRCRKSRRCVSDGRTMISGQSPCGRPWQNADLSLQLDLAEFGHRVQLILDAHLDAYAERYGRCGCCGLLLSPYPPSQKRPHTRQRR